MPPTLLLLFQIALIVLGAKIAGQIARRFGQPPVVGEMAMGIIVGPSVFGLLAPKWSAFLFPTTTLGPIQVLSQIGLMLFMFTVGLEFNPGELKSRGRFLFLASHSAIANIFVLGTGLAMFLYPRLSDSSVTFVEFALFLSATMSLTAFPVLALILRQRNLTKTQLGVVAIGCSAVDEVSGWCLIAYILGLIRAMQTSVPISVTLLGLTVYVLVMIFVVRPILNFLVSRTSEPGKIGDSMFAVLLVMLTMSAAATDMLGIHQVFGAFFFGVILPKSSNFSEEVASKVTPLTQTLLLPLLFASVGLRTSINSIPGNDKWLYLGLLILTALLGKFGSITLVSKLGGLEWRHAISLGVLMNTRGLMEIVIASIGLEMGIINQALFSMLVLVALVTTFITTPLLELVYPERHRHKEQAARDAAALTAGVGV